MVSNAKIFKDSINEVYKPWKKSNQNLFWYLYARYGETTTGRFFAWVGLIILCMTCVIAFSNNLVRTLT
jgi:hypothetical protein